MLNYCNKIILAPMVRQNKLPFRILALKYGADLIYTEELVDVTMLMCKRKVNDALGTVDFVDEVEGNVKFRTTEAEKKKLVFQIGTSCPERAVALAKLVQNDVSGIDVNMGCPAKTSTGFGMGSALLYNPKTAKSIVENLVKNIPLRVKTFYEIEKSIELAKDLQSTGISAIAIHGRTPHSRTDSLVDADAIREIAESLRIPVIANGASNQIECHADIEEFREACGTTSVMIANAAVKNVSIFRKEGLIPIDDVAQEYLKLAVDYDESIVNVRYFLERLYKLNRKKVRKLEFAKEFDDVRDLKGICKMWGLEDYCSLHEAKGYKRLPCASFHNLNIETPEIYEHRLAIIQALRQKG